MSASNGVENALWIKGSVEKQADVESKISDKYTTSFFTSNIVLLLTKTFLYFTH